MQKKGVQGSAGIMKKSSCVGVVTAIVIFSYDNRCAFIPFNKGIFTSKFGDQSQNLQQLLPQYQNKRHTSEQSVEKKNDSN